MLEVPLVSVVMGVYNAQQCLATSIESILNQDFSNFELIIINDGSWDDTGRLCDQYVMKDSRVRGVHQENQGLTLSLIKGCAMARGAYIARQDADDVSLPTRFERQIALMEANPDAVMCATGIHACAPEGEVMDVIVPSGGKDAMTQRLRNEMQGVPSHGCMLFRRDAYEKVGGYRPEFYYAQDADLWLRLGVVGNYVGVPEVLYLLKESLGSISSANRAYQSEFCQLAQQAYQLRSSGNDEQPILDKAAALRAEVIAQRQKQVVISPTQRRQRCAASYKLFAARLRDAGNQQAARKYLRYALRLSPLSLKLWKDYLCNF